MPTGHYSRSLTHGDKIRLAVAARQAAGLHFGRPITATMVTRACERCGNVFTYKQYPKGCRQRFCGRACRLEFLQQDCRRVVRLGPDELRALYHDQRLTSVEIGAGLGVGHHPILATLHSAGIPVRAVGSSRIVTCIEVGCHDPVYRILHRAKQSRYGRRCETHWRAHRAWLATPQARAYNLARRARVT